MITLICGVPRVGKTAYMTALCIEQMRGYRARQGVKSAQNEISYMKDGGFEDILFDAHHVVYTDYPVCASFYKNIWSYRVDGFHLGLPNDDHEVDILPPWAQIYIDEAQRYYNSRKSNLLPDFVSRYYELHGHYHVNITLVEQRAGLIDLNIRELATRVVYVDGMEERKQYGMTTGVQWTAYEFDSAASAIRYVDSGFKRSFRGDRQVYNFDGDIFRYYDSFGNFNAFIRDLLGKSFSAEPWRRFSHSVADVAEFNRCYSTSAPSTFYAKGRR